MKEKIPNSQYNVARPDSLPVKLATYQRRRMYRLFLEGAGVAAEDAILDVGVTSDQTYASSNYLEAWYPHKGRITACGLDDAAFLEDVYPGVTFVKGDGLDLPFGNDSFDVVHSSAVLEHVGNFDNQTRLIRECARVARKSICLTTPNRWFPIEFHTVLPLVHWLPKSAFRGLMRRTGRSFFAEEANLNLMTRRELGAASNEALRGTRFAPRIATVSLGFWPSNLVLIAVRAGSSGRSANQHAGAAANPSLTL